jgi:hypothetical protein
VGGTGFASDTQLPNWIYLNRDGTVTPTPTGGTGGGDFIVDAENRVWEHLAVDRTTAQIIA